MDYNIMAKRTLSLFIFLLMVSPLIAQSNDPVTRLGFDIGLNEPLLVNGFSADVVLIRNNWTFSLSHASSFDFKGFTLIDEIENQGLVMHYPYSTGFGIGYFITGWLSLRYEQRWNRLEFYYAGAEQTDNHLVLGYNTMSAGLGLHAFWRPFKNTKLKGLAIMPNVKFWPTISNNLGKSSHQYYNSYTNKNETLKVYDIGMNSTPMIFELAAGYFFGYK